MYDKEKQVVVELLQLIHDELTSMAICVAMVKETLEAGRFQNDEGGQKMAN